MNGRIKGKVFERVVAKDILQACQHGGLNVTSVDCFRTPLSGGHVFASKKDPGDLQLSDKILEYLPILVECKCYREIRFERFLGTPRGSEFKWLDQVIRAAKGTNRIPVLVMKGNNRGIFVTYPLLTKDIPNNTGYLSFYYKKERWKLVCWDVFLKQISCIIQKSSEEKDLNGGKKQ